MKKVLFIVLAFVALGAQAKVYQYTTLPGDPMQARIYTLDNGLTVYLTCNHEKPEIQTYIAVRAGAQNDPITSTGLAHYQEHIMFKGTTNYGTTDYEAERPLLDKIDNLYELYGQTTDPIRRKAIYHEIDSISYEASKIAIANEFDKLMAMIGATGVNAYTSTDRTCYHEVIPAGELRRWAMIEADRFQNLVVRGFHTELEAVYEEFNMYSTMDQMKVLQAIDNILYPEIPYRQHTVLGTQNDLKNPSLKNIKQFYDTYYRPNNVAICLSGDLDFDHAITIIDEYFGQWKPNLDLPKFDIPEQKPMLAHKDTTVYGKETAEVWMAWQFPGINDDDIDAMELMASVLYNGKCGLFDLDISQRQQLLAAGAFPQESYDYSTFYLIGYPKDGQDLNDVKRILLDEIEKLKKGDFSENMLDAIIANERRMEMQRMQLNSARVQKFVDAHIYGMPYEKIIQQLDRMAAITKNDIMRVANQYLGDNYACVFKQQRDTENPMKVDKPTITPIEMNREKQSDFLAKMADMHAEPMQPQFFDMEKDVRKIQLDNGQTLLYCPNTENDLFDLEFIVKKGTASDPVIELAIGLLDYLKTGHFTAEEYQTALYALASSVYVYGDETETHFAIHGLQDGCEQALALLEEKVLKSQPDDKVLKELVNDLLKAHEDNKSSQDACFNQLQQFGWMGQEAVRAMTLTPKQFKNLTASEVLKHLRALIPAIKYVTYYGPAPENWVLDLLNAHSDFIAQGTETARSMEDDVRLQEIKTNEVWMAPYKANNIYMMGYANWGEVYSPKDEAIIRLFNEYFDGSMGSIVFQEMRESRALCYASKAYYRMADKAEHNNSFLTFIITQNDKLQDCINAFDSICNMMPLSQAAFDQAKTSLLKQIEQRRYVRSMPIDVYLAFIERGWDHDWNENIYNEVRNLTLDDVLDFQRKHVANRTYRYLILGNQKDLDMKFLKTKGTIKKFKLKDIFVY